MRVDDAGADGDGGDGVDSDGGNSMGRGEGDIFPPCVHLPTEIRAPPPYSRLQLNAGLNFIVGKNGSGKSAMCNAAQVCGSLPLVCLLCVLCVLFICSTCATSIICAICAF